MPYSDKVLDHYENPRNVGSFQEETKGVGTGIVGAPSCGDVMKLQIKVGKDSVIEDVKFMTFGCGSAIASSSLATEMIKGKTIDNALKIKNSVIVEELSLPPVKIHCSILAEAAIRAAVANYKENNRLEDGDDTASEDCAVVWTGNGNPEEDKSLTVAAE
ncbi:MULTISPECIES: Fe-S cluster assembly scaffold IscU [Candidatus Ichthyocystis]|uniref:Fe-S cluster assembly scaffold IscU n=1 Tax=Candidatus Ichthyocystis TaxID=2929841 RepID=UPI000A965CC0|nr:MULTISPECIES: Fe-S cluster assembly scaffold IscU [Ichthyocystis]